MRTKIKLLSIISFVAIIGFTMATRERDKLSGTYERENGYASLTFKGNQITMKSCEKVIDDSTSEIKSKKIYITKKRKNAIGGATINMDFKVEGNNITHGVFKLTKK